MLAIKRQRRYGVTTVTRRVARPCGAKNVGQDGILRAGWQPAVCNGAGGFPTRRRLPTCPTRLEHHLTVRDLDQTHLIADGD